MTTAYLNGQFLPLDQARVSITDRGFLFADGVYEVSSVLEGRLVDNAAHLARLERSLGEIELESPVAMAELPSIQTELIERNSLEEGVVYIQISRGPADRDFHFPAAPAPTIIMFTQEKSIVDSPLARDGVHVISTEDLRWKRRDIKSVSLLAQVLAKQAAHEAGAHEAWMVEDGYVTEGSSSSAFIVTGDGEIVTRKADTAILPGVTRKAVLALAAEQALTLTERPFSLDEAWNAKEVFMTSASSFVLPIVRVDGRQIGDGRPGPTARRLRELYLEFARKTE